MLIPQFCMVISRNIWEAPLANSLYRPPYAKTYAISSLWAYSIILYVKILTFQATCACYLNKHTAKRIVCDIAKFDKWDNLLENIQTKEDTLQSVQKVWQDFTYQENWEKRTSHGGW